MTSERAQKSEVHETTDDASTSPGNESRTAKGRADAGSPAQPGTTGPAPQDERSRPTARPSPDQDISSEIGGGPGAGDASSGGGAGAGIPGGGTDMRIGEQIPEGDADEDRARLFPDSQGDKDESDFGGPARIETDEQGKLRE